MLLHHSNKVSRDGSTGGAQAYRDATAIFDSVRAAWYLRGLTAKEMVEQNFPEEEHSKYLFLENSKNNYIEMDKPRYLMRDGFDYVNLGVKVKKPAGAKKDEKVQKAFTDTVEVLQEQTTERNPLLAKTMLMGILMDNKHNNSRQNSRDAIAGALEDGFIEEEIGARNALFYKLTEHGKVFNLNL